MLTPLSPKSWDFEKAAHLLNRAGFGGTPETIRALQAQGVDQAVNAILNGPDDSASFPAPDWAKPQNMLEMARSMNGLSEEERKERRKEMQKESRRQQMAMIGDWVERMRTTANPLREKMTLFWHGHFATSAQKVRQGFLMLQQNQTLRANALGNFGTLTKAISRDPAMMIYLDTDKSKVGKPNENFARELMELFTVGIGNYTEQDVQEAARAFTGYRINPLDQTFRLQERQADQRPKTFLGQTGPLDGDGVIDRLLTRPACSQFIARKIWVFFGYEEPAEPLVNSLASSLRAQKYEIRPLLREIFRSQEFYSERAIRTQIKSPIQWLVQTAEILDAPLPKSEMVVNSLRQMGQVPFMPPNVKGWDGGKSWITTSTLLYRYNLASFIVGESPMAMDRGKNPARRPSREHSSAVKIDFARIAPPETRRDAKTLVEAMSLRLFQAPSSDREMKSFRDYLEGKNLAQDRTIAGLLHMMMSTPSYQLT